MTRPADVRVETGLAFGGPADAPLLGDLYRPDAATPGPYPVVVIIHGGAFHVGSRSAFEHWGRFLAREGFAAFSIDYTLATAERPSFPTAVNDARAAVRHMRENAASLELDAARLAVMGCSAGATLAATLVLTADSPDGSGALVDHDQLPGSAADRVDTAIVVAGTYDLIAMWEHDRVHRLVDGHTQGYIGGTPMDARRRFFEAAPLTYASRQNAEGTRWLISWGTHDDVVPPERQSVVFAEHLSRAGAMIRLAPIVGAPHFWYLEGRKAEIDPAASTFNARFAERLLTFLRDWCSW
jgi:acetyl esterase/lipase